MNRLVCQAASEDYYDAQLAEARDKALELGWDVIETPGGAVAVPHGTEVVAAPTIDALMNKLRAHLPVIVADDAGDAGATPAADRYVEIGVSYVRE